MINFVDLSTLGPPKKSLFRTFPNEVKALACKGEIKSTKAWFSSSTWREQVYNFVSAKLGSVDPELV